MKRVIEFTKIRYVMFVLSLLLITGGIIGTVMQGGFNFGIDFQAGLSQRIQIAPVALKATYSGDDRAVMDIGGGIVSVDITKGDVTESNDFALNNYGTVSELAADLGALQGLSLEVLKDGEAASILGFNYVKPLGQEPVAVNIQSAGSGAVTIDELRKALGDFENPQIQIVGDESADEFLVRVEDSGAEADFAQTASAAIKSNLVEAFGEGTVLVKQSDYIGPRFSRELGSQTFVLAFFALLLILLYIWFRFTLVYAVSAIVALLHDVLIMLGFIGLTQMEIVTATIAAVLTIIGYSLNDTIVIFDRVRENNTLLRDSSQKNIVNTSINQSLTRTLITSITTLLAVAAIYIFASGQVKDFALAMIVGVLVGTYSSIFIASPVYLGWVNTARRRHAKKNQEKYGRKSEATPAKIADKESSAPDEKAKEAPVEIPTAERKKKGKRQERKKK